MRASLKRHAEGAAAVAAVFVIIAVHAIVGEEIEGAAIEQRLLGLPVGLIVGDLLIAAPGFESVAVGESDPRLVELPFDGRGRIVLVTHDRASPNLVQLLSWSRTSMACRIVSSMSTL